MSYAAAPPDGDEPVWLRPWPLLLAGLAAAVVGMLLISFEGAVVTPARLLLIAAGLITAGCAVRKRLANAGQDFEERLQSAGFVAASSLVALVACLGMDESWTSGRLLFGCLTGVALVGALLVLLPLVARRLVIIGLIVVHFGGILVATTALAPPSGEPGWLPNMVWLRFYRPYLSAMYLTNSYHFYSPDPSASDLLWFRIEYADDQHSYRWVKFPNRRANPMPVNYYRMLAMAGSSGQSGPPPAPAQFEEMLRKRRFFGNLYKPEAIPLKEDMPAYAQYREPNDFIKRMLASYVRHMAKTYPHPDDSAAEVKSVKIYRLTYSIIPPIDLAQGKDPADDGYKIPFFLGEYTPEGRLVRGQYDAEGRLLQVDDPFLYWVIPMREYVPDPQHPEQAPRLVECLKIHAGDIEGREVPQP